jgi:hypothetical protein
MKSSNTPWFPLFGPAVVALVIAATSVTSNAIVSEPATPSWDASQRFGPFGLLDRRSTYGTFWFPEPLRADEMDLDRELRVDYFHSEKSGQQFDQIKPEVEWNIGLVTLEAEFPYERTTESHFDPATNTTVRTRTEGFDNVNLAARGPLFEFVAPSQNFDYTLAGGFEVSIPNGSPVSQNTELVPALFQLMRIGEHVSVQIGTGVSFLIGLDNPVNTLETNVILGYEIEHDQLPLPFVLSTVPMFELNDETTLSGLQSGANSALGTVGVRFNMNSIGPLQPRPGIGFVFPLDSGGRDQLRWGIVFSLNFEL